MDIQAQIHLIGSLLVSKGFFTQGRLDALEKEIAADPSLGQEGFEGLLISRKIVSEDQLLSAYGDYLGIEICNLPAFAVDTKAVQSIPAKFANKHRLIAIKKAKGVLTVALRDPFDVNLIDELKLITKLEIDPVISRAKDIAKAISLYYGLGAETVEGLIRDTEDTAETVTSEPKEAEDVARDSSIINYVTQLLADAHHKRATDIHIEPFENRLRIRFRIDGILYEAKTPQEVRRLHSSLISRFKIMANLNIAERRRPQDGRCKITIGKDDLDLRLSTFPTLYGEGISIRLLSRSSILLGVDQLGLGPPDFKRLKEVLNKPNGIVLVTGPTGCGKTTTLYACLNHLNDTKINIVTLEEPVEYQLEGINQIQISPKVDLSFANGLRSVLRQDPDVIMVGEIRDLDTAQIAIRAALTGHLIFSTLHTNDALATVTRLFDLGIERYLVANTLRAVIAQRLVRVICKSCRKEYTPDKTLLQASGLSLKKIDFLRGSGCAKCNGTGFKGRTALFEVLTLDEKLITSIVEEASIPELRKQAKLQGFKTLKEDGLDKIAEGITTLEEVLRVTEQE